ncbi:MAG: GlsB/YeaQ/YmgE family stress response membrane protein [Bacteroidota bacterium]
MQITILLVAMIIVGLIVGWLAGPIWKDRRPIGVRGDYIAAIISAAAIGLLDWYVIPAMGFSTSLRNLGVAIEPAIGALIVLWIIRLAKRS